MAEEKREGLGREVWVERGDRQQQDGSGDCSRESSAG